MATGYYKDLSGKTFEKLTAISPYFHKFEKNGRKTSIVFWDCICECGNQYRARSQGLISGATKSCGCFRVKPELKDKDRERRIGRAIYAANISDKNKRHFSRPTDLSFDIWWEMSQKPCTYCGLENSNSMKDEKRGKLITDTVLYYNGIDRVDSAMDYSSGNCVTCCKYCNWFKLDDSISGFLTRAKMVYNTLRLDRENYLVLEKPWINAEIPNISRPSPLLNLPLNSSLDITKDFVGQNVGTISILEQEREAVYKCQCVRCGKQTLINECDLQRRKTCKCNYRYISREDAFWNAAYQDNILGPNRRIWNQQTDITPSMYEYIASLNCFYCQKTPQCYKTDRISKEVFRFSTLDKLDPHSHYHWDNVAPACRECNFGKNNQTIDSFLTFIKRLVEYQTKNPHN